MALLNDNNYYIPKCYSIQFQDLPNSGFLETDENGVVVASQYNKFSVFPKSWSIFANQLIDLPVNLTADPAQFYGFYTEPDLNSSNTYSTQVDINISAGFYNLYVLCYLPQSYGGGLSLRIGSQFFTISVTGQPNGNNIIRSSNALEIPVSGQYFGVLNISDRLGVTQIWLSAYNPPLSMMQIDQPIQNNPVSNAYNPPNPTPQDPNPPITRIFLPQNF
jgi:hypothetical protein